MANLEDRIRSIVASLPDGAAVTLPRATLAAWLDESEPVCPMGHTDPPASWRTLIWDCPADTRLSIAELSEALGKSKAWIYRRTSAKASTNGYGKRELIPHEKAGGELVFRAGEIRDFLRRREHAA